MGLMEEKYMIKLHTCDSFSSTRSLCAYCVLRKRRSEFSCSTLRKPALSFFNCASATSRRLINSICSSFTSLKMSRSSPKAEHTFTSFALSLRNGSNRFSQASCCVFSWLACDYNLSHGCICSIRAHTLSCLRLSVVWTRSLKSFSTRGRLTKSRGWRKPSWSSRRLRFWNLRSTIGSMRIRPTLVL